MFSSEAIANNSFFFKNLKCLNSFTFSLPCGNVKRFLIILQFLSSSETVYSIEFLSLEGNNKSLLISMNTISVELFVTL